MSSCNVAVRFESSPESYASGDEVSGTVAVTADTEVTPRALRIRQLWRVHGKGNRHEQEVQEKVLDVTRLAPGVPCTYPFRFAVPARPVTYHGALINVDHYVQAEVELDWAMDPSGEASYVVEPGAASAEAYVKAADDKPAQPRAPWILRMIGWVLLPLIVAMFLALIVVILPILLVVFLVTLTRRMVAEMRLGEVTAEIGTPTVEGPRGDGYAGPGAGIVRKLRGIKGDSRVVSPGQEVPVRLRFNPARPARLSSAEIRIEGVESATSGSGKHSTTHRHVIWEKTVRLVEPRELSPGQPVDASARVELPPGGAFTLDAPSNRVAWSATFRIDVPGWPDWVRSQDLKMVPPR